MARKPTISSTEIRWMVNALQHRIAATRDEMDKAVEGSPVWSIGELQIANYSALVTKLMDIEQSDCKSVRII